MVFREKISIKWLDRAHEHFPFLEQMCRHEEFPALHPFFPRTHFPPFFWGRIFFFRFSQSAVECKLANILHLAFSEKTPYLLWHTCLQGSCLCHRIFTAISDAVEPLAHVLCCTRVMGCQWKQEPISTHLPCRNPKMLVVSSQTWKSKKERTQNLQTMVRRTSIFRQCYALIVIAVEKFFYTGSCCSHNWDFLWAVSLHRWSHGEILNCPQMQGKKHWNKSMWYIGKNIRPYHCA